MVKLAVEQFYNGGFAASAAITSYDQTKTNYGKSCRQLDLGSDPRDKFAGPIPPQVGFAAENALAIPINFVHPIKITEDLWWIFGSDMAAAAATRRIPYWTWIPSTNTVTFVGSITLTFPTATNHTTRGLRAVLTNVTNGTVAVSGTAVTGTTTTWLSGISVGSRIGFGSTDPNAITTWFEISAVGSDTGITLTSTAGTIAGGTPYVIQDLMLVVTTTNATTTNGGLFVVKGLRPETFQQPGIVIPAATTVDKIRAVYWLKDAATVTNTVAGGAAIDTAASTMTSQFVYVCDGAATSLKIFKYNFRAALTLTAGAATLTGGDIVITGAQTVTGNISQAYNGRVATLGHGPGSGVSCLYLLTTSRILRIPVSGITAASTTFMVDNMTESVPGGVNTNVALGTWLTFDVSSTMDRMIIMGAASFGTYYCTQYNAAGAQHERRFGSLTSQTISISRDVNSPIYPHPIQGNIHSVVIEGGICFFVSTQLTSNLNQFVIYPLGADYLYTSTTAERIIGPKITINAQKLYRVFVNCAKNIGDETMGIGPDAFKVYYRTSGISDNSGAWTLVSENGDLTAVGTTTDIQFAFEFRTMGVALMPARILNLVLTYETVDELPSQYRWNISDFITANGTFAWIQKTAFGASPGVHTISIFRADTNALVLTQASTGTTNGTFEFWNGSAWTAGLSTDTVGTRRRFTPTGSLPAGISLYAQLTVA